MHFADHRIAGDAIGEFRSDLTRALPIEPKLSQLFDALISPGHASSIQSRTMQPTPETHNASRHGFHRRRTNALPSVMVRNTICRIRRGRRYTSH
jgi:hypothetical protein